MHTQAIKCAKSVRASEHAQEPGFHPQYCRQRKILRRPGSSVPAVSPMSHLEVRCFLLDRNLKPWVELSVTWDPSTVLRGKRAAWAT